MNINARIMYPKEPLPNDEKSSVVYKIRCKDCPCNYIGEITKRLKTRVHEQELAIKRQEQHSQVWTHMANHGHVFNLTNAVAICRDATKGGRLLKEAWLSDENSINRHIELFPAYQTLKGWEGQHHNLQQRQPAYSLQDQKDGAAGETITIPPGQTTN